MSSEELAQASRPDAVSGVRRDARDQETATDAHARVVIAARDVGKMYRLYDRPQDRLKEQLFWRFGKSYGHEFWALQGMSLDVQQGEALGIIGRNGSGKSTLLQIIAGTLNPTCGVVTVRGRVAALLELGSGFNPEFTGRENVYLNGAIIGLSRNDINQKFREILAFADIGQFIDQPVKTYSSGMVVRLAFAVQVAVAPEILIVDEALSVGDVFFQQKCFAKIREILAGGTTLLFVSHDMAAVLNVCSRALLLGAGRILHMGQPEEVVSRYYSTIGTRPTPTAPQPAAAIPLGEPARASVTREEIIRHSILDRAHPRHGAGGMHIVAACVTDASGRHTLLVEMLGTITFHILVCAREAVVDPSVGIHLYDRFGNLIFAAGTRQLLHRIADMAAGQELIVRLDLTCTIQPGEYTFSLGASEPSADEGPNVGYIHDRHEMLGPLCVSADPTTLFPFYGIAQLPTKVAHWLLRETPAQAA